MIYLPQAEPWLCHSWSLLSSPHSPGTRRLLRQRGQLPRGDGQAPLAGRPGYVPDLRREKVSFVKSRRVWECAENHARRQFSGEDGDKLAGDIEVDET